MCECGTAIITDPADFPTNFRGARFNLLQTAPHKFKARVTWLKLGRLDILHCEEDTSRIALISLTNRWLVSFSIRHDGSPIESGVETQPADIALYGPSETIYQRTNGATSWSCIIVDIRDLAKYRETPFDTALLPDPAVGKIWRPSSESYSDLVRIHRQACRLVETKPSLTEKPEVLHAMRQDLLYALLRCLTAPRGCSTPDPRPRDVQVMARFERAIASAPSASVVALAGAVGLHERTLRRCCATVLGMSPRRYIRLRQLNMVRTALRRADPVTASVGAVARQHGFSELGRFAGAYRAMFGETPSATLGKARAAGG